MMGEVLFQWQLSEEFKLPGRHVTTQGSVLPSSALSELLSQQVEVEHHLLLYFLLL